MSRVGNHEISDSYFQSLRSQYEHKHITQLLKTTLSTNDSSTFNNNNGTLKLTMIIKYEPRSEKNRVIKLI